MAVFVQFFGQKQGLGVVSGKAVDDEAGGDVFVFEAEIGRASSRERG